MNNNPWHDINSESVLFVVDADHKVEEKILLDWLNQGKSESEYQGSVSHCVVPIAHDPENISTEGLEMALQVPDTTLVVPVRVFWKTSLDQNIGRLKWNDIFGGNPRLPNERKAEKILQKDLDRAVCIAGKAATLSDLITRYEQQNSAAIIYGELADYVASQAGLALEVAERRMRGSRYKVPRQVSKQIRASDIYRSGLLEISAQSGEPETELRARALPYFKELVATPHSFWQDVAGAFNRWVISLAYENKLVVDVNRLQHFRNVVRENPSALLWTHKTHMDGITMHSVLFEHDFPTPHTMGGINMAFAGAGYLARRSGAIFIRRSFQDNPLYKLVLRRYLSYLLEKRFPLTWSFEGTRSRVGKLMPPRYGMLKYVMDAMSDSTAQELYIVPVAINYDMNNDVKDYAAEQSGAIKRPESLSWFISYLRRLRRPLGRIYIDFGDPVIVNKESFQNDQLALQKTAFKVGVEANRVTPITLTSLMSMSLLGSAPRAQTIKEMQKSMEGLRVWAAHRDISFTKDFNDLNKTKMIDLIDGMVDSGLISRYDEGPETVYAVAEDQHAIASYYRNTIAHHFVIKSITELSLLKLANSSENAVQVFWQEADYLKDMFKFEFFYVPTEEFHAEVRQEMVIVDPDWEAKITDSENAVKLLKSMSPFAAHACLKPYIEAYRVVADVFARLQENETLDAKELESRALKYGKQAYLQRRISSKASVGKILFNNGYKLLDSYGVVAPEGENLKEKRRAISKELRVLVHRIEQIRNLSLPNEID